MKKFTVSFNYIPNYILIISIVIALIMIIIFPKWTVDDAYIIFRYARNLATHSQLTWNLNEKPVEGYTGIILPFLITAAFKINVSPILASHLIGIISYLIGGIYLFLLFKTIRIKNIISSIVILIYSTTPILYTHVFSGLETILFTSSITIAIYYTILFLKKGITASYLYQSWYFFWLLFLSLIRPEGILLSILLILAMLFYLVNNKDRAFIKKVLPVAIVMYIIPFLIYYYWRWNYYGQFFPNTYYLKAGVKGYSFEAYHSLINMIKDNLGIPFIIALFLFSLSIDKVWKDIINGQNEIISKEFLIVYLASFIFILILTYQYINANLLMNFSHRFFVPFFPILLVSLAILLNIGLENFQNLSKINPFTYKFYFFVIIIFVIVHFVNIISSFKKEIISTDRNMNLTEAMEISVGKFIGNNFNQNKTLLVYTDAGAIPFYSNIRTVDFGGINDKFLSHIANLSKRQIVDYFFSVNADILSITSYNINRLQLNESFDWDVLKLIKSDTRFKKYKLIKVFGTPSWGYYQFVFTK